MAEMPFRLGPGRSLAADCCDAALNFDEAMKKCYQHCPVWGEQLDNVLGHVYEQRCGVEMVGHVMYAGGGRSRYGSDGSHRIPLASTCAHCPQGGFQPPAKGNFIQCDRQYLSPGTEPTILRCITLESLELAELRVCRPESSAWRPLVTDRPGQESQPRSGHSRN